jgi:hypothetical protein
MNDPTHDGREHLISDANPALVDEHGKPFAKPTDGIVTALRKKLKVTESLNIVLTAIIASSAVWQGISSCNSNKETGKQVDRLICASNRNAQAAQRFADAAGHINLGIADAVGKLNNQVEALKDQAGQSTRLANETKAATDYAVTADRPWLGAKIQVKDFSVDKTASFTVTFTNSGRRPAYVTLTSVSALPLIAFPSNPDSILNASAPGDTRSTSLLVPGETFHVPGTIGAFTQPMMDILNTGADTFFVFAKAEYRDVRSKAPSPYRTHICMKYLPKVKSDTDNGFRNCSEYNDAQ